MTSNLDDIDSQNLPAALGANRIHCRPVLVGFRHAAEETRTNVSQLTFTSGTLLYSCAMHTNTREPMSDVKDDLRTDHTLILLGIGAALMALIYLLLS